VIIERKRATYYAIGLTLLRIVEAILKNQCTVLSVTSPMSGQYGVSGMSLSLPSIVCRDGVHSILDLPISQAESEAFKTAGTVLTERMSELG
jgi:L-lactate dehydrogenase